jgi:hypothetical protein
MNINSAISKFITNKWVLNVVFFLALFNVIGYIVMGNLNLVLYFTLFAGLTRYFSKNMTIVLGIPLIIVNLFAVKDNMLEGMKSASDKVNENEQEKINSILKKDKSNDSLIVNASSTSSASNYNLEQPIGDNAAQKNSGEQQGFESGRRKNRGNNIDYATTIEDAYDELNNILGRDGIQRLKN